MGLHLMDDACRPVGVWQRGECAARDACTASAPDAVSGQRAPWGAAGDGQVARSLPLHSQLPAVAWPSPSHFGHLRSGQRVGELSVSVRILEAA